MSSKPWSEMTDEEKSASLRQSFNDFFGNMTEDELDALEGTSGSHRTSAPQPSRSAADPTEEAARNA
jgi:hypothetical protein